METTAARAAHFTTVSEAELRRAGASGSSDDGGAGQWIKIGLLCTAALVVVGGVVFYATLQPSADVLYARVEQVARDAGPLELIEADEDISQFLALYPNDERAAQLRQYQDEIELYRLERRFEVRARRGSSGELLTPVERAYLDAQQYMATDPHEAQRRFQAIVDVYTGAAVPSESAIQKTTNERGIELAKKQAERLAKSAAELEQEQKLLLRGQLERADKLAADKPNAARAIWQGIVTLYADKGWAEPLVKQARERLLETPQETGP